MAEVLITLAIIGIVAAITIPSIVANHQKKTLETQFAKTYRTLQHVINMAIAEHGSFDTWDWKETYTTEERDEFVKKYFMPYFNVAKYCKAGNADPCKPYTYTNKSNNTQGNIYLNNTPVLILADGTIIVPSHKANCISNQTRCMTFDVDINGSKKPNVLGEDIFGFEIRIHNNEFTPHGLVDTNAAYDETIKGYPKNTYEKITENCNNNPWLCAAKVVTDGFKINY